MTRGHGRDVGSHMDARAQRVPRVAAWRSPRLWLACAVVAAALGAGSASASAAEPPVLASLSILPSSINTGSSSQTVKVSAEITSTSGLAFASVQFAAPTGGESTERVSLSKVSGTVNKGVWEATVPFKQYITDGTWKITSLNLIDKEGTQLRLSASQLKGKGFPAAVSVEGTEDNEPPALSAMSVSPTSVNTTASSQVVTVTAHITDNLSGLAAASIVFKSPNGQRTTEKTSFSKVSGTATNGTYEAKVTFKRFIAPGPWKVSSLRMEDNVGNEITLTARRLQAKGFTETVQVESIEDEAPPALAGLSITPSSVNVASSSQTVTVSANITDDLSGVASASVVFESPNGKQVTAGGEFSKVSGTETNGIYESVITFNQFIQSGTWRVRAVSLRDNVGNEATLSATQLEAKGFPATVKVSSSDDSEAPALAGLTISPSSVNTTSSSESVTVTAEITDNLSGFDHGSVVFESPSGKVITNIASFTKVSGSATSGTYEAKVTFKPYVQGGTWKVSNLNLTDAVGNEANLSASQIEGKGFPATVHVESSEDTEPPVLTGLAITPSTINTATANQDVIVTAQVTDNLSGFKTGTIQFESENGKHQTGHAVFNAKISGTEMNGGWEAVVTFKQSLDSGTWKVKEMTLLDNAGNEATVSAAQLEAKSLPDTVVDETGAPPTVKKVSPKKGPAAGGELVTITGTNFKEVSAVKFGTKEAIGFTVMSLGKISATVPEGTTGAVDVTVTTASGTSAISSHDHFRYEAPTITSVTPNHGPRSGGTEVTITGSGFEPGVSGTMIKFGKTTAAAVNCSSRSSCTAIAPATGKVGGVEVTAIVGGKKSAHTSADRYTFT
jgi:IPT/TIG domain/Bacterial Ig-like domain